MDDNSAQRNRSRQFWIIALILSLLLLLGSLIYWIVSRRLWETPLNPSDFHTTYPSITTDTTALPTTTIPIVTQESLMTSDTETETVTETTQPPLADNPVDFPSLQEINPDVYAWIYLPMGPKKPDIDLPVLQSRPEDSDNFYLHKDIHRNYLFAGSIYTQKANAKDFSDRVTVVYGHNMLDGTMFSNLVYFQDADFFDKHEFFYIYTPGHILTYRIAAAIQFDTRHLLNSFDFSDDRVFENWIQSYILHPKSMIRSVRKDVEVTTEDKLVILSTCLEHGASRYLIQGVLISDEPTN